jgi:hypothetical protein
MDVHNEDNTTTITFTSQRHSAVKTPTLVQRTKTHLYIAAPGEDVSRRVRGDEVAGALVDHDTVDLFRRKKA